MADGPTTCPVAHERLDFREVVSRAKDRVFPAVIYIRCLRESHEQGRRSTEETGGSGVLVSSAGHALTNWHVVDKATEVRCLLYDGRAMTARVLGTDKDTDLAVIQLQLPAGTTEVPFAELGDSQALREGDFVMAMGAPWGLNRSVSIGIVSCIDRFLPEASEYSLWLQTDASISPGNSGGPLVNTEGQVVGITTRGVFFGGDMGFAIPAETIRLVLPMLRDHGRVTWSWLGLQLQPLRDFKRNMYFEGDEGVIVAGTDPDSPARRGGILPRDRLLRVNGRPITALTEEALPGIRRELGLLPRGRPAVFEVLRDGRRLTVELTPQGKGQVEGEELDCPGWDFTVKTINQFENPALYFHRRQGVYVLGVRRPGNAADAGLAEQDIILRIDGREITTLEDIRAIHARSMEKTGPRRVLITVLRNGLMRQIVLDYSRDYERQ